MSRRKRNKNLQPWLDYFGMLYNYVVNGFLQMEVASHEAYVTLPAIYAMTPGSNVAQILYGSIARTAQRLRTYAAWLSAEGDKYLNKQFAIHVVKDNYEHDLIYTMLLTRKRRLFKTYDKFEVINYPKK
ncbi:MAG: hypothetical protein ACOCNX_01035 [Prevotella sp.]